MIALLRGLLLMLSIHSAYALVEGEYTVCDDEGRPTGVALIGDVETTGWLDSAVITATSEWLFKDAFTINGTTYTKSELQKLGLRVRGGTKEHGPWPELRRSP